MASYLETIVNASFKENDNGTLFFPFGFFASGYEVNDEQIGAIKPKVRKSYTVVLPLFFLLLLFAVGYEFWCFMSLAIFEYSRYSLIVRKMKLTRASNDMSKPSREKLAVNKFIYYGLLFAALLLIAMSLLFIPLGIVSDRSIVYILGFTGAAGLFTVKYFYRIK